MTRNQQNALSGVLLLGLVGGCSKASDSGQSPPPDLCKSVDCSSHGACSVAGDETPTCQCDVGYHNQDSVTCVADLDPCSGVGCSNLGHCEVETGNATCVCDPSYHADGLTCVPDDPCVGVDCGASGSCVVQGAAPSCSCDPGYKPAGLSCVACSVGVSPEPGLVATTSGAVQGQKAGTIYSFLGVPFAAPPVGTLRWAPPQAAACSDTPIAAAALPAPCAQKHFDPGGSGSGTIIGSEDCLYLNVWTEEGYAGQSRPVLVFMHGGGNAQGSTSNQGLGTTMYDGARTAERGGVVVVTLQYRLGPFGYLTHPTLADANGHFGNWGLLDQIQALTWVQRNIAAFGGDPSRVVLFGQSAGAVDTCMLLTSPLAAGLFSRTLMESGACIAGTLADRESSTNDYLTQVGCDTAADVAACLHGLDVAALLAPITQAVANGLVKTAWGPTVDGWVLPKAPMLALQDGSYNHMPLVVGSNADEMAVSVAPGSVSPVDVRAAFHQFPSAESDLLGLYPPGTGITPTAAARDAYIQATSDAQFTCNARRILRAALGSQTEPIWRYFFTHTLSDATGTVFGSYHGLELFFVFQTLESSTYATNITAGDTAVEGAVLGYWTRFASSGDPNGAGAFAWPPYDASDAYVEINATPASGTGVRQAKCDVWDTVAGP